ncbi:MAG: sulfite exporter TauE/SafE family protein [Bacteroidetes bacterium]|nr:sulfite exporter TauE/SafE family protein [Bacteroidota bacterium]
MSFVTIITLIASGLMVGIINTYAAGGVIVSTTVLMAFGMPITTALGTNRICVFLQNLTSTLEFRRQGLLDIKHGLKMFLPIGIGTLIGSIYANWGSEKVITAIFILGGLFSLVMVFAKRSIIERPNDGIQHSMKLKHKLWFFVIGLYAGTAYSGMGYMLLTVYIFGLGYDLIRANALKAFTALILSVVAIIPFMISGHINYEYGLIHSIGNILGAYIASKHAKTLGVKYIRWIMITMIIISLGKMLYDQNFFQWIIDIF